MTGFLDRIAQAIRSTPAAPALVTGGQIVSFAALGRRMQAIRTALARDPGLPGPVLVSGHKEADAVAAMLACMFAARPFVFVDRANPPERAALLARLSGAGVVVAAGAPNTLPDLPRIRADALPDVAAEAPVPRDPGAALYVIFTSGSTGTPKGVPISLANYQAFDAWYGPLLQATPEAPAPGVAGAHVNHASLAFDMGMLDLWSTLALGRPVILLDHADNILPRRNIAALTAHPGVQARSWFSTPSMLQILCTDPAFGARTLPGLRCFFTGGEMVPRSLVRSLWTRFPEAQIRHAYGPSEATCMTHVRTLSERDLEGEGVLPLGPALGKTRLRILDPDGRPLPTGTTGEIELCGPQVVAGYSPPDHPANRAFSGTMPERRYRTGDLGHLDPEGGLMLAGRADRQVKWNGNRIELDEIEHAAHQLEAVHRAACLAQTSDGRVSGIVLFIEPAPGQHPSPESLALDLGHRLTQTMIPRDIRLVSDWPMTVNGKLDTGALARRAAGEAPLSEPA
ncbi:AMP-binding protein [Pseudooceanicola sp. CBS1P-1]|uniref:AMP-binding protein n=1 Tax=Pseudooceanicola albus TaxID=2692189 RepID=A0A6L7G9F9_9RHOB|nr:MULTISPECIES: AMP-binding protein [Pseudooceanicola]MBT9386242.1 AMP-binding protein [Pseudooceanicola endophyticus]MXN20292.1 AMP-binding protein [Pseudooceanicola albus]